MARPCGPHRSPSRPTGAAPSVSPYPAPPHAPLTAPRLAAPLCASRCLRQDGPQSCPSWKTIRPSKAKARCPSSSLGSPPPRSETLSLPWRRAQGAELTAGQVPAGRAHPKGPPPGQCVAEGHSRPPTAGRPGGDVSREAELHQCARQTLLVPTKDGPKLDL